MHTPIAITGLSTLSALGGTTDSWDAYKHDGSYIHWDAVLGAYTAALPAPYQELIRQLRDENSHYKKLDNSVLYALYTSREAIQMAGWTAGDFGINIGSSRGATQLFEDYYSAFAKSKTSSVHTSPSTTLGNISSWVAQDLKTRGPDISHSITCSTALHAVINGIAWLYAGMADRFLVGGSEAALTPFTVAQMSAMKLLPPQKLEESYPCRALDKTKQHNTMVLGEGAGMACLELGKKDNALAYINGFGYATEKLIHAASLSTNGSCFQKSMAMALGEYTPDMVDAIVMHAPGTIQGDQAELEAIKTIFCNKIPLLTTNKWKMGHTFGASGLLNMALAIEILQYQEFISVPYLNQLLNPYTSSGVDQKLRTIMVNAVGFGGNAVSILLTR